EPMFTAEDSDQLVADHAPPKVLLVAEHHSDGVVGYTATHPHDGEMFLLFVHPDHARRGIGGTLLTAAHDSLRAAGYEPARDVIEVGGFDLAKTKKFRDAEASGRAAIVVDDLASVDPWRPRGVEIRGRAHVIAEPTAVIRIE